MVYIVEELDTFGNPLGRYKVGFTAVSPEGRLDTIQTGNSHPCRLLALFDCPTDEDERRIHAAIEAYRSRDKGEWFAMKAYDMWHFIINSILGRDVKMRPMAELSGYAAETIQDSMFKVYLQKCWVTEKTSSFILSLGTPFQEVWRHYYAYCEAYGNKQMRAETFFRQIGSAGIGFKMDSRNDYVYNMRKK